MKNLLYLILITIIFALGYLKYWGAKQTLLSPSPSPSPAITISPSPTSSWLTFSTDLFTLTYPPEASASERPENPDSKNWAVTYMGETQRQSGRTQTELFDGYALNLTAFEIVGDDPAQIQAESDRQATIDACGLEGEVTPITSTSIASQTALTYSGGCLGRPTSYYFSLDQQLFRLSVLVVGSTEDRVQYLSTVDKIIASLHFSPTK